MASGMFLCEKFTATFFCGFYSIMRMFNLLMRWTRLKDFPGEVQGKWKALRTIWRKISKKKNAYKDFPRIFASLRSCTSPWRKKFRHLQLPDNSLSRQGMFLKKIMHMKHCTSYSCSRCLNWNELIFIGSTCLPVVIGVFNFRPWGSYSLCLYCYEEGKLLLQSQIPFWSSENH